MAFLETTITISDWAEVKEAVEKRDKRIKDLEDMLIELIDAGHKSLDRNNSMEYCPIRKAEHVLAGLDYKPTPKTIQ